MDRRDGDNHVHQEHSCKFQSRPWHPAAQSHRQSSSRPSGRAGERALARAVAHGPSERLSTGQGPGQGDRAALWRAGSRRSHFGTDSQSFSEAVQKESLRPAVPPQIETSGNVEDGEFSYVATFDVYPEIGTIDVSKLKVKRPTANVEDSDIDAMIETLRQQRRTWTHVDRPAQNADLVLFEFPWRRRTTAGCPRKAASARERCWVPARSSPTSRRSCPG